MQLLEMPLRQQVKDAEHERQMLGRKALLAYTGQTPPVLKVKPGDPDDNVYVNYSEVIVDKGVDFLFGQGLKISIGKESDKRGEARLEDLWPEEQRSEDLLDLGTNGGIFGHAWVKLAITEGMPEVVVLDPLNMSAKWERSNYKRVRLYRNQYNTVDENDRPIVWREEFSNRGDHWVIQEYYSRPSGTEWIPAGPAVIWSYPFPPVFQCKNLPAPNEFYGRPDLSRYVLALIHYLARVDSLINRILRVHAFPKPIAKGLKKQDLQISTDEVLFLPDKEQDLKLLEMAGDLEAARLYRRELRQALAEVSHVPEVVTSKLETVGPLSGRALRILYGPLIDRTERKRRLYGRLIADLIGAILHIGGAPNEMVQLMWPEVLPADEVEKSNTALIKRQLGVSQETLLRELGYDPEAEKLRRKDEDRNLGEQLLRQFDAGE